MSTSECFLLSGDRISLFSRRSDQFVNLEEGTSKQLPINFQWDTEMEQTQRSQDIYKEVLKLKGLATTAVVENQPDLFMEKLCSIGRKSSVKFGH
ncbi:hypothetical protein Q3G72_010755 [Acer saccharum]|nr:hypothetical protein Q3G72_010755 [Acer saccharum]